MPDVNEQPRLAIIQQILDGFEETYREFIKEQGLPNHPIVKAGVYAALQRMVWEDPIDLHTQKSLVAEVGDLLSETLDDFHEQFEAMFVDLTERKMKYRL